MKPLRALLRCQNSAQAERAVVVTALQQISGR